MCFANVAINCKWYEESFKKYKKTTNNNTFPRYLVKITVVAEARKHFCQVTYTFEGDDPFMLTV